MNDYVKPNLFIIIYSIINQNYFYYEKKLSI